MHDFYNNIWRPVLSLDKTWTFLYIDLGSFIGQNMHVFYINLGSFVGQYMHVFLKWYNDKRS